MQNSLREERSSKSGWISLEPDFVTSDSNREDSANFTESEESKIKPITTITPSTPTTTDFDIEEIKLEAPYSDSETENVERVVPDHSFEIKKKESLHLSSNNLR